MEIVRRDERNMERVGLGPGPPNEDQGDQRKLNIQGRYAQELKYRRPDAQVR